MVIVFQDSEIRALRQHVEGREDNIEDVLSSDELALITANNYQNSLWYVRKSYNHFLY